MAHKTLFDMTQEEREVALKDLTRDELEWIVLRAYSDRNRYAAHLRVMLSRAEALLTEMVTGGATGTPPGWAMNGSGGHSVAGGPGTVTVAAGGGSVGGAGVGTSTFAAGNVIASGGGRAGNEGGQHG